MKGYSDFLSGLVAAPYTPMQPDGSLCPKMINRQVQILLANNVSGAFVCGSTGECHSLTTAERMQVAEAWKEAIGSRPLKLIVHVGHNCIEDARALSAHAAEIKADASAAAAPCYFKPATVDDLVSFCSTIAAASPKLPFYYYDIPSLTGVNLPTPEFLRSGADKIPNLAGLKFTSTNLMALQQCLEMEHGQFNILFGVDEMLLAALALGVRGAVGSTYNYAAPLYHKIISAFRAGDHDTARALQRESVRLVAILSGYGVLAGGKALMHLVGAECGPVRSPLRRLTPAVIESLRKDVQELGVLAPTPAEVASL